MTDYFVVKLGAKHNKDLSYINNFIWIQFKNQYEKQRHIPVLRDIYIQQEYHSWEPSELMR